MSSMQRDTWNNDYVQVGHIGEGVYGTIYKAVNIRVGTLVAVEKVRVNSVYQSSVPSTLIREIMLLKLLQHPNIVSLEDVIINDDQLYLVFEFVNMSLKTYISKLPDGRWMEKAEELTGLQQKSCLYQILQAICYCHQRNILHLDLKPANLLVNRKGCLKVAEFRFDEAKNTPTICKKISLHSYKAPELLFGCTHYTSAVDIWSVGCIAAEMALKESLFSPGDSNIDQIFRIFSVLSTPCERTLRGFTNMLNCSKMFPEWKNNYLYEILNGFVDPDGIVIVQKMLTYEPAERISAEELLKNPYFADVDQTKLLASEH